MRPIVRSGLVASVLAVFAWVGCASEVRVLRADDDEGTGGSPTSSVQTTSVGPTTTVNATVTTAPTTTTGAGSYECNPVTNEPCGAGEACDMAARNGFLCFGPPNEQAVCEPCDNANGPWCQGTMSCFGGDGICRRYCCDDGDCGPSLACEKVFPSFPEVGLCTGPVGGTGAAGAGGGPVVPGCGDVPAMAPSNGACVPFP